MSPMMQGQDNDATTGVFGCLAATVIEEKIRLRIVDDHPIVRFGLTALLGLQEDFEIVGTAEGGEAALAPLASRAIDIILLDLRMPGYSGIQTLEKTRAVAPKVRTIVLSCFECDEEIYAAVEAGARGYLHKEAPSDEILSAIRSVHAGRQAFPRRVAERLSE